MSSLQAQTQEAGDEQVTLCGTSLMSSLQAQTQEAGDEQVNLVWNIPDVKFTSTDTGSW